MGLEIGFGARIVVLGAVLSAATAAGCAKARNTAEEREAFALEDVARNRETYCRRFALEVRHAFNPQRFRNLWRTPSDADWDVLAIMVPYCRGEVATPWAAWLTSHVRLLAGRTAGNALGPEQRAPLYSEAEVAFYDLAQINISRLLHAAPLDFWFTQMEVATAGTPQPADTVSLSPDDSFLAPLFVPHGGSVNARAHEGALRERMCIQLAEAITRQEQRMRDPASCDLPALSYDLWIGTCAKSNIEALGDRALDVALATIDNQVRLPSEYVLANFKTEEGRARGRALAATKPPCPFRQELVTALDALLDAMEQDGLIFGFKRTRDGSGPE